MKRFKKCLQLLAQQNQQPAVQPNGRGVSILSKFKTA